MAAIASDTALAEWEVRAVRPADLAALHDLALLTGGGFTNLPPDRDALARRIGWSADSNAASVTKAGDEIYMLVLHHRPSGRIGGTACLFAAVGQRHPFYSYKLTTLSSHSRELDRGFRTTVLHLVNDFDGCSEVGGLFLHPDLRTAGLGRLLARARYLFMARHRERFAGRVLAELRGVIDAQGNSPFWDGLAGRFFGMDFVEADRFNGIHGSQFIADMMPKFPVYVALLPPEARAVLGVEHAAGARARGLLEAEGFQFNGYVDIFDGGPTMDSRVADLRAVREAAVHNAVKGEISDIRLVAAGRCADFRCRAIPAGVWPDGIAIAPDAGFTIGEELIHAPF